MMKTFTADEMMRNGDEIQLSMNRMEGTEAMHTHEFIELVYIYAGKGIQTVGQTTYPVTRGDLLFINYGQTHSFRADGQMVYVNFLLKPEFITRGLQEVEDIYELFSFSVFGEEEDFIRQGNLVSFRGEEMVKIQHLAEWALEEYQNRRPCYRAVLYGYLHVLLACIVRKRKESADPGLNGYFDKITPDIMRYIDSHYNQKLSLTDLADKCFYNPSYFSRMFRECYGMSLSSYIREKRLKEAAKLLVQTALSAEQIGEKVGYRDKAQFYKFFKEEYGMTPNEFRRLRKKEGIQDKGSFE